ncbi:MAG: diguanylate cyclase [Eubacterium sp.]|nr:diguanylate cyclase [Eubacterium sp.]
MLGILKLINKDVRSENESRKVIVVLRILYIVVFLAFILDIFYVGFDVIKVFPYRIICLFLADIILFIITYRSKTFTSLLLFMGFLGVWTLLMIPCFGWSAGMQNYFIIILMLCFFATHGRPIVKFFYAGLVLLVRILTILIFGGIKPVIQISQFFDKCLQITNISAVFISIIFISYVFSQKQTEEESKLMKYNDRLKKEASTDQLTGLYNRRKLMDVFKSMQKYNKYTSISLAMGDIDFFKNVNDTYGHDVGDEVLKSIADTMREKCPENSVISRWGGEEFLIIFPNYNGDDTFQFVDNLRLCIENRDIVIKGDGSDNSPGNNEDIVINVTMTYGISEYDFKDIDNTIKEADNKLYIGKQNGRNQVVY